MNSEILVRSDDRTDPAYGIEPEKRSIQEHIAKGVVNLDKPSGPTSHQVASWVKNILGLPKAGHSGTLDPKVTGVLPIALGESTKILPVLLTSQKQYLALLSVHGDVKGSELKSILSYFQGEIYQKPPLKSAVKRQLRKRNIYSIRLLEREGNYALFYVDCEAGTYIRKLCHDIGLVLGVGGHMEDLRRTKTGPFTEENITSLQDLKDAYEFFREDGNEKYLREHILPMEYCVKDLRKVWVKDSAVSAVCHGADLAIPGVSKLTEGIEKKEKIALMTLKNELVATATAEMSSQEMMDAKKGCVADLQRVIMEPDVYPRKWKTG